MPQEARHMRSPGQAGPGGIFRSESGWMKIKILLSNHVSWIGISMNAQKAVVDVHDIIVARMSLRAGEKSYR